MLKPRKFLFSCKRE